MEGVDLYGLYNKVTDWTKVRAAGIEYAWVKLTDGMSVRDDYGYVRGGKGVGITMGGYHYAQKGSAVSQANHFISRCTTYGALDLAPALDLEDPFVPGREAIEFSVEFLNRVAELGHTPCLYANNSMLSAILPEVRKRVPGLKVWLARYGANPTVAYDVWQYTSTGRVNGISGDVDRNRGEMIRNTRKNPQNRNEDDMDLKTQVYTNTSNGNMNYGDLLGQDHDNLWTLRKNMDSQNAKLDALVAAVAAISTDPDITEARMVEIVNSAVKENMPDVVNVTVTAGGKTEGNDSNG